MNPPTVNTSNWQGVLSLYGTFAANHLAEGDEKAVLRANDTSDAANRVNLENRNITVGSADDDGVWHFWRSAEAKSANAFSRNILKRAILDAYDLKSVDQLPQHLQEVMLHFDENTDRPLTARRIGLILAHVKADHIDDATWNRGLGLDDSLAGEAQGEAAKQAILQQGLDKIRGVVTLFAPLAEKSGWLLQSLPSPGPANETAAAACARLIDEISREFDNRIVNGTVDVRDLDFAVAKGVLGLLRSLGDLINNHADVQQPPPQENLQIQVEENNPQENPQIQVEENNSSENQQIQAEENNSSENLQIQVEENNLPENPQIQAEENNPPEEQQIQEGKSNPLENPPPEKEASLSQDQSVLGDDHIVLEDKNNLQNVIQSVNLQPGQDNNKISPNIREPIKEIKAKGEMRFSAGPLGNDLDLVRQILTAGSTSACAGYYKFFGSKKMAKRAAEVVKLRHQLFRFLSGDIRFGVAKPVLIAGYSVVLSRDGDGHLLATISDSANKTVCDKQLLKDERNQPLTAEALIGKIDADIVSKNGSAYFVKNKETARLLLEDLRSSLLAVRDNAANIGTARSFCCSVITSYLSVTNVATLTNGFSALYLCQLAEDVLDGRIGSSKAFSKVVAAGNPDDVQPRDVCELMAGAKRVKNPAVNVDVLLPSDVTPDGRAAQLRDCVADLLFSSNSWIYQSRSGLDTYKRLTDVVTRHEAILQQLREGNVSLAEISCPDPIRDSLDRLLKAFASPIRSAEEILDAFAEFRKRCRAFGTGLEAKVLGLFQDAGKKGGGVMSGAYGDFFRRALNIYFKSLDDNDRDAMISAVFRYAGSEDGQIGAFLKGAGPILQKFLQALPPDFSTSPELAQAIDDMKSRLAPINADYVRARLEKAVQDSVRAKGKIRSISVVKSLGCASVAQAFLCRVTFEGKEPQDVVVKMLRPGIHNRAVRERDVFMEAVREFPGLRANVREQVERMMSEMDFSRELKNINDSSAVYPQGGEVEMNRVVPGFVVKPDMLVVTKMDGKTVDDFVQYCKTKIDAVVGRYFTKEGDKTKWTDPDHKGRPAWMLALDYQKELDAVRDYIFRGMDLLQKFCGGWIQKSFFSSGIVHLDPQPGNIMLNVPEAPGKKDGISVIDFGNAGKVEEVTDMLLALSAMSSLAAPDEFVTTFVDQVVKLDKSRSEDPDLICLRQCAARYRQRFAQSLIDKYDEALKSQNDCKAKLDEYLQNHPNVKRNFEYDRGLPKYKDYDDDTVLGWTLDEEERLLYRENVPSLDECDRDINQARNELKNLQDGYAELLKKRDSNQPWTKEDEQGLEQFPRWILEAEGELKEREQTKADLSTLLANHEKRVQDCEAAVEILERKREPTKTVASLEKRQGWAKKVIAESKAQTTLFSEWVENQVKTQSSGDPELESDLREHYRKVEERVQKAFDQIAKVMNEDIWKTMTVEDGAWQLTAGIQAFRDAGIHMPQELFDLTMAEARLESTFNSLRTVEKYRCGHYDLRRSGMEGLQRISQHDIAAKMQERIVFSDGKKAKVDEKELQKLFKRATALKDPSVEEDAVCAMMEDFGFPQDSFEKVGVCRKVPKDLTLSRTVEPPNKARFMQNVATLIKFNPRVDALYRDLIASKWPFADDASYGKAVKEFCVRTVGMLKQDALAFMEKIDLNADDLMDSKELKATKAEYKKTCYQRPPTFLLVLADVGKDNMTRLIVKGLKMGFLGKTSDFLGRFGIEISADAILNKSKEAFKSVDRESYADYLT